MSLSDTRAHIADALSTVDGVKGHATRPRTARSGDAWPLYQGSERNEYTGLWAHKFAIGVMLPQDQAAADAWIDSHFEAIADAMSEAGIGWVDEADPADFGTDASPVYGLVINMRSD